ncbi:hypothetical protein BH23BAC3_BH23BAC3_35220 [soil metagenome]
MEIDLTSIIIGIAALSTFFVPIGLHQFSHKRNIKKTQEYFESVAENNGLQIDHMEVLRNGIAMGIVVHRQIIIHIKNSTETLLDMKTIASCSFYKHQRKEGTQAGDLCVIQELGIQIALQNRHNRELKLILFEGKEGITFGDEDVIIRRWIDKINSVLKKKNKEAAIH